MPGLVTDEAMAADPWAIVRRFEPGFDALAPPALLSEDFILLGMEGETEPA